MIEMGQPCVRVCDAPREHVRNIRFGQHKVQIIPVDRGHGRILLSLSRVLSVELHIHLRNVNFQPHLRCFANKALQTGSGLISVRWKMTLHAYSVNRHAAGLEPAQQCQHLRPLFRRPGRILLNVVVVIGKFGVRIGFGRGAEGQLNVVGSDQFQPWRFAQAVRKPILGLDCLIHHIPALNLATKMSGYYANVIGENLARTTGIMACFFQGQDFSV